MKFNKKIKSIAFLATLFSLVFAFTVFEETVSANRHYFGLVGGGDLNQNWTDLSQITVDDDWSNVVSMQGYRGDGLVSATGVDPQTITADGHSTPLDVNANETNPDTFSTGGVAEFHITNPTIALKGSGTADAPHLMIYLDTTPCPVTKSISIRYNVRDIDGSTKDSVQQLALQYRIGNSGAFINVPAGFVADATEPNTATKVTPILANLPAHIINNPMVEIRLITTNAAGTDEWVGIDDINVGCFFPTAAGVSAGGKVVTPEGRGISRASVQIFNTHNQRTEYAMTNQFGHFNFEGLNAGDLYIFTIGHRRYSFTTATRTVQMVEDKKDFVFYADGNKGRTVRTKKSPELK